MSLKTFVPSKRGSMELLRSFSSKKGNRLVQKYLPAGCLVPEHQANSLNPSNVIHLSDHFYFVANTEMFSLKNLSLEESQDFDAYQAFRVKEDINVKNVKTLKKDALDKAKFRKGLGRFKTFLSKEERFLPAGSLLLKKFDDRNGVMKRSDWLALTPDELKYQSLFRVGLAQKFEGVSLLKADQENALKFVEPAWAKHLSQRIEIDKEWNIYSPFARAHLEDIGYLERLDYEQTMKKVVKPRKAANERRSYG